MALPTPLKAGYVATDVLSNAGTGLTKGTLFWTCFGGLSGKVYSSSDGFTWTDRTTAMRTDMDFDDPNGLYITSPCAIGDVFVCYVQRPAGYASPPLLYTVAFDGTSWGKTAVDTLISVASTSGVFPIKKANGIFFLMGADGLYSSTDGLTWTKRLDLTDEEPGGPTYWMQDIIYSGTHYYAVAGISYPGGGGYGSIRSVSSDLISWTSYSDALPIGAAFQYVNRLYSAGGEFYLESTYYLLKSADFITWTIVEGINTAPLDKSYYPLGNGFLVCQDFLTSLQGVITWLPYSKTTIGNTTTAVDAGISGASIASLSMASDAPLIDNGYVFVGGVWGTSAGYVKAFKYEDTWDDGVAAYPVGSTLSTTTEDAVASFLGTGVQYTNTIQGTLRLDTSIGPFAARNVYLYDYTTGAKVAETTSDGTTGVWEFTAVAPGEYFVVGVAQSADLLVPRDFDALGVITVL